MFEPVLCGLKCNFLVSHISGDLPCPWMFFGEFETRSLALPSFPFCVSGFSLSSSLFLSFSPTHKNIASLDWLVRSLRLCIPKRQRNCSSACQRNLDQIQRFFKRNTSISNTLLSLVFTMARRRRQKMPISLLFLDVFWKWCKIEKISKMLPFSISKGKHFTFLKSER